MPLVKWQDILGVVGVLVAFATLMHMPIPMRLGCLAACAACLAIALLSDERWSISVRLVTSIAIVSAMAYISLHIWKTSRLTIVREVSIEWKQPRPIASGQLLNENQLNAVARFDRIEVPGTYLYYPAFGATLPAGNDTLSVEFIPRNPSEFKSAKETIHLLVVDRLPGSPDSNTHPEPLSSRAK